MNERLKAKIDAVLAFAGGPGIMIEDEKERMSRLFWIYAAIDVEFDDSPSADVLPFKQRDQQLNVQRDWHALANDLRSHPGKEVEVEYANLNSAKATATRQRSRFPDLDVITESRNGKGVVILSFRPSKR